MVIPKFEIEHAKKRAIDSLRHSVGILHADYKKASTLMKNATKLEIDNFIDQPYSFPGSYPKVAIMADGGCLCHKCARDNIQILLDTTDPEWTVLQIEINYEDNLWCDHCGDPIEQAYGDN